MSVQERAPEWQKGLVENEPCGSLFRDVQWRRWCRRRPRDDPVNLTHGVDTSVVHDCAVLLAVPVLLITTILGAT